jgi:ABC-type transport system substrate-binding protein
MKKVVWAGLLALVMSAAALAQPKVLRYAFRGAETGFDPARVSDSYSNIVNTAMFDAPLRWAYLARPFRMEPAGCELPEVSADFRTITLKVRPGIFFADDPAFKGRKRELVAADYVYSIKRHYDPATNSPNLYIFESAQLLGLSELRRKALRDKKPFEYDTPVEGLKVLDKYTWQIRLGKPDPRFVDNLTNPLAAALAREVVEHYGDKTPQHPVGTAAFMLKQDEWRRSSRIVLVKNPNFRDEFYAEQAPAERPDLQALAQRLKGRKLPMVDRVEIAIIEEPQPRWLSFLGREAELIQELPGEFAPVAIPHGQLAPNLAARGIQQIPYVNPDINHVFFNLKDPVVGGYSAAQVALRRALSLAYDSEQEIRHVRRGQMIPAQGLMPPGTWGYDPSFRSSMNEHSPAKAKALLDLHGFKDRDGDGWRERPDGSPLRLLMAVQTNAEERARAEIWEKSLRGGRREDRLQVRQVPREPQGQPRRQADDVGRGLDRHHARRRLPPGHRLRPECRPGQPFALRSAGLQHPVRAAGHPAQRSRAPARDERCGASGRGLHALQGGRPPHLDRPGATLADRLRTQHVPARLLRLRRHRP